MQGEQTTRHATKPLPYRELMRMSTQIKHDLDAARAELEGVHKDLPKFEERKAKAEAAVTAAVRAGANMEQREALTNDLAKADRMLSGQRLTVATLEATVATLERELENRQADEAAEGVRARLETAEEHLRTLAARLDKTVVQQLDDLAAAYVEVIDADRALKQLEGSNLTYWRAPMLGKYLSPLDRYGKNQDALALHKLLDYTNLVANLKRSASVKPRPWPHTRRAHE